MEIGSVEKIQNQPVKNIDWSKIEERTKRSTIGSEDADLDLGKDYINRLIEATEEISSKPREGTHVSDLCLCLRQRVFKQIDRLPIGAKTVSIFAAGQGIHGAVQWLYLSDRERFEREKHLVFRGIRGSVDIYDKIRNIPLEFKTSRVSDIKEPKPFHLQQLRWYMAILGSSRGILMYQCLLHFGNAPFKAFIITMNAKERKSQLDKLVEEATSLQRALEAKDPSLVKPVINDPALNWLCSDCPYQVNCKRIQEAAAAA
jgi:CRISPR/Cas system-associated exonuclease Cas4 (RecB family)